MRQPWKVFVPSGIEYVEYVEDKISYLCHEVGFAHILESAGASSDQQR